MTKRSIPQPVFDSSDARRVIKAGNAEACRDLERKPCHLVGEGDPNHPMYELHLFGEHYSTFMNRQHRVSA